MKKLTDREVRRTRGQGTSHDYGFGDVDTRAAVRMAETWQGPHTSYNERHLASCEGSMNGVVVTTGTVSKLIANESEWSIAA